jgi:hypothetical protein
VSWGAAPNAWNAVCMCTLSHWHTTTGVTQPGPHPLYPIPSCLQDLWPACSIVFDGGQLDAGRSGSTIVDLSQPGSFCITRRGAGFARTMQLLQEKYQLRHVLVS